jgi:uncharacterized protein
MSKKTLILGASTNPSRYSNKAANSLTAHGHAIVNVGRDKGEVAGETIYQTIPSSILEKSEELDTITLYLSPQNQESYFEQIVGLKPKRVIFNPGTENQKLEAELDAAKIPYEHACTLVLLATNQF